MKNRVIYMKEFYKEVRNMPYYRNYQASSGAVHNISKHEDAVEAVLLRHGAVRARVGKKVSKSARNDLIDGNVESIGLQPGEYMAQPCGPNNSPDFIVFDGEEHHFIECKSSKQAKPTFNSGMPNSAYVYIFCSEKTNETTLFRGNDVVTDEQIAVVVEFRRSQKAQEDQLNKKLLEIDVNNRGFQWYTRPMYVQAGKSEHTSYFKHKDKSACEERIIS